MHSIVNRVQSATVQSQLFLWCYVMCAYRFGHDGGRFLTASGYSLLASLAVLARMDLYLLPEGSR